MEKLDPANAGPSELHPCPICGRTFRPDALQRHHKICQKNAAKKRKVFDSSKQRALDENQAPAEPKSVAPKKVPPKAKENQAPAEPKRVAPKKVPPKAKVPEPKPKPQSNWREKHEELIRTIKKSRDGKSDPDEEKHVPAGYVQCPACERHFNQRAAERHIPWCQQKKAETPKSPATDEAKEKLIARVRYRPPQGKSRMLNRKAKTAASLKPEEKKGKQQERMPAPHSSPPVMADNENTRTSRKDKVNNNSIQSIVKKSRSGSRGRDLDVKSTDVTTSPELPLHIIKFKERFPNHNNKRNVDLEESFGTEQLRELLSKNKIPGRCPRTVPGVRLSGGPQNNKSNNNTWSYRSTDVSRSASSSGGSTNSWNKQLSEDPILPEVSSSELPGSWTSKFCWSGDYENFVGSTGSSGGSSSGGSLPPLSRESIAESHAAFHCHQCHSKFPLVAAKYCCECGARRRAAAKMAIAQTG